MKPHGINFHYFEDDNEHIKCQGSINEKTFSDIIEFVNKNYNLLNANEFYSCSKNGMLKENDVCLTFDDGLKGQYDIALPVLKKYGITAFFFIYTSHFTRSPSNLEIFHDFRFSKFPSVEDFYKVFFDYITQKKNHFNVDIESLIKNFNPQKYLIHSKCHTDNDRLFRYLRDCIFSKQEYDNIMYSLMEEYNYSPYNKINKLWFSEDNIRELHNSGNIIGLHSHTHPTSLLNISYDQQLSEYKTNKHTLELIINNSVAVASYPSGKFNADTLNVMKLLNIDLAFCSNMEDGNINNRLLYPRKNHTDILAELQR